MSYKLIYDIDGFILNFKGYVTINELNEANGEMHGHYKFDEHNYQVVNLLEADISSVTMEDTKFPAETDGIASRTRWGVKVAFVVVEKHAFKIVDEYMRHCRILAPKWEFRIFSTQADALLWAK